VLAGDKINIVYKRQNGSELNWQIVVQSQGRVYVRMAGGLIPDSPVEISVTDLDRIEDQAVTVFVANNRTKKTLPVQLLKVADDPGTFKGIVKTAAIELQNALMVNPDDQIEVSYLDVKGEFHQDRVTVIKPRTLTKSLSWSLGFNFIRSFTQPSRKPLLAELCCLEARLHHYRSTERCAFERQRTDLIEAYLLRAHDAFKKMDLTTAWEALHDSKRQEIYLMDATEAEGCESQVIAEAKDILNINQQASINKLMKKAETERNRSPASNGWRGFVGAAMRILYDQQNAYYIRQNMLRDRLAWVSILLVFLLFGFFQNLKGTMVADALASNRGLKDIILEHALFQYGGAGIAADNDPSIRFEGETVLGNPLVLLVNDVDAYRENTIKAELGCTDDTKSLCPKEWPTECKLNKLPRSKGLFRSIFETGASDPDSKRPGYFKLKPGAELLAKYKSAKTDSNGLPKEVNCWTRILDSKLVPDVGEPVMPSPRALIIAGCLLGAIGACLSTLMSLSSGTQVPNLFDSAMVTVFGRPVIGFTAALLLFIALNAKIISFDPTLTIFWLLSLISGFSDRFVLGVVNKVGGSGSEKK
jgi:hypothetical protein